MAFSKFTLKPYKTDGTTTSFKAPQVAQSSYQPSPQQMQTSSTSKFLTSAKNFIGRAGGALTANLLGSPSTKPRTTSDSSYSQQFVGQGGLLEPQIGVIAPTRDTTTFDSGAALKELQESATEPIIEPSSEGAGSSSSSSGSGTTGAGAGGYTPPGFSKIEEGQEEGQEGVDIGQPSPGSVESQPFTQPGGTGAISAGGGVSGKDGALASKFEQGFEAANAALSASGGTTGGISGSQGASLVQTYAPSKSNSLASTFVQTDPFIEGLVSSWQQYISPQNQRASLAETYQAMLKDSGIQAIDTELLNMKNVIEGAEEDIRTEITKAGGFATNSQVLALTNARNRQLIKNYNTLLDTRNAKEKYLQTAIQLEQSDRESADRRFESAFSMGLQIADYKQKMETNAKNQMQWLVTNLGFDGLYDATGGDQFTIDLVESSLGIPKGGLLSTANRAKLERAQAQEKTKLELEKTKEDIKLTKAQTAKTYADIKKDETKTGLKTITPYQHEQATRIVNSTNDIMNRVSSGVVGTLRAKVSRFIPGTDAANFKADVEQLKTQVFTRELAAMRDASKTGGAVGNVSDTEGERLAGTLGSLDLNQSPEQFKTNLKEIQDSLNRWYSALADEDVVLSPDGTLIKITD